MTTKDKLLLFLIFGGLLLCVLVVAGSLISNNLEEKRLAEMPAIPVTFETIASHVGDKVSVVGEIIVESGYRSVEECGCDECNNREKYGSCYSLWLSSLDYDPDLPDINFYLYETTLEAKEPNHFYLPMSYQSSDFRIYTYDGQELTEDDPIRLIGFVCFVDEGEIATDVYMCDIRLAAVDGGANE